MLNKYIKSGVTLFIGKVMHDMKEMKAELNEHRYYLERNVERRTEHLLKRIELLEYCNATLCDKLALARKELVSPKQQLAYTLPNKEAVSNDRVAKLCVMTRRPIESNVQDKLGEHVIRLRQDASIFEKEIS